MRYRALFVSVLLLLMGLAATPAPTPTPTPELVLGQPYEERREEIIRWELPPDLVYPPRDMSDWQRIANFLILSSGPAWMHPEKLKSHPWLLSLNRQAYEDCVFGWIHGLQDSDDMHLCGRFFLELARRRGVRTAPVEDPEIPEGLRLWRIPRGGRVRIEMPSRFIPEAPKWKKGPSGGWDYLNAIPDRLSVVFSYIGTAEVRFPDPREIPYELRESCPPHPSQGPVPARKDIQDILNNADATRSERERLKNTWWAQVLMEKGIAFVDSAIYRFPADWREGEEPWWVVPTRWGGCPYYELVAPPDEDALVYLLTVRLTPDFWGYHVTRFDPRQVFTPMPTLVAPTPAARPPEPPPWVKASDSLTPSPYATPAPRRVVVSGGLRALGVVVVLGGVAITVALWLYFGRQGGER